MDRLKNTPELKPNKLASKTNGVRNRVAGHSFEREVVKILKDIGFAFAATSRAESRSRDGKKVDIMNSEEHKNGRLPYNFQCKNLTAKTKLEYYKLLDEMPSGSEINIVLHNRTVKTAGNRFLTKGQYAVMKMEDLFRMIQQIQNLKKGFELLNNYFDSLPEEDKAKVAQQLTALGL